MLLKIHPDNPQPRRIAQVVECLKNSGLIIYPTDTLYGLGCDIHNKSAMERLHRYKGINQKKANLSFICSDLSHISEYAAQLDNPTYKLMKRALPGPYTFILKANSNVPKLFRNNKKTVGIRVPDHAIAHAIINELGNPIVSTSVRIDNDFANYLSNPEIIHAELGHLVDIVIDGGVGGLIPSTIINCTGREPVLIREGKGDVNVI